MSGRRKAYRPDVVLALEVRLALSAAGPVSFTEFGHGPLHPVVIAKVEGSDRAKVIAKSGQPGHGQFTFSAQEVALNVPNAGGPAVATFKVNYNNESTRPILAGSIVETLGPDLSYVPDGLQVPPGGQLIVTKGPNSTQMVELKLPEGIAPSGQGSLEFEAEEVQPASTR